MNGFSKKIIKDFLKQAPNESTVKSGNFLTPTRENNFF